MMENNNEEDFDRCPECGRPFIEGETAYYISELPAGFRDKDTIKKVVCKECYTRLYSWNNLITRVKVE